MFSIAPATAWLTTDEGRRPTVLARAEVRISLEELMKLEGRLEEAAGELTWNKSISVRGLTRYPIRYVSCA